MLAIHDQSGFEYQLTEFAETDLSLIDKIYFTADHEILVPLEKALKARFKEQLSITFTSPEYLEIMNYGVSKGQALQTVLDRKGILPEETVAFGDGMNDKEMLQLVGHGVVMDNATDAVKQAVGNAEFAEANSEDGVARYIEERILPTLI